jgi:hypothetical protein
VSSVPPGRESLPLNSGRSGPGSRASAPAKDTSHLADLSEPFRSLERTLKRWRLQIAAWHEAHVTNGPTEAIDNLISGSAATILVAGGGAVAASSLFPGLGLAGVGETESQAASSSGSGDDGGAASSGALEPQWAQAPDNGFLGGWSTPETLEPGTVIDRYGNESGRFFSPNGTSFAARSLPGAESTPATYEVLKPVGVQAGIAAPAFGQPGLGVQYMASQNVSDLIRGGYIKEAP